MAFSSRVEDFRIENFAHGLDHKRSIAQYAFGHYVAAEAATWESGMLVDLDASGNVIKSVGAAPFGVAKYNKGTGKFAAVHAEYIQLNGVVATNLKHPLVLAAAGGVAGVRVLDGAVVRTEGGGSDYVVNYANGTIVRAGASAIADGAYVYVDYHYAVSATDLARDGFNFWNQVNDTTIQGNKTVVVTGRSRIFTSMYSSADTFAVGANVTAGTTAEVLEGYFRAAAGAGAVVGKCFQVPTADDPYLGVELFL